MKQNDYFIPGITAIILALISPIYWIQQIISGSFNLSGGYVMDMTNIGFSNWVFLIMGLMLVYIYHSFKKALHERLNFKSLDILLWIMIVTSLIFFVGQFIFDMVISFNSDTSSQRIVNVNYAVSLGCMIVFAIVDVIIAIILLSKYEKLPTLIKALGIVSLIQGVFGLTFVFWAAIIISFPVYLIILAVYFLKQPDMVEVV